jgi:selenocysteine-specific elongation factor
MHTIGGGVVVDAEPQKHKRFRPEVTQRLQELVSGDLGFWLQKLDELQLARLKELEKQTGTGRDQLLAGLEKLHEQGRVDLLAEQWVNSERLRSWKQQLPDIVSHYHSQHPLRHGMPRATLQAQISEKLAPKGFEVLLQWAFDAKLLTQCRDLIATPGWQPQLLPNQQQMVARIETHFRGAGFDVKNNQEVLLQLGFEEIDADEYFSYLYLEGMLVRLNQESSLHMEHYRQAEKMLISHFTQQPTLTLAQFRDQLGSGRKLTQALLELFDSLKYTRRVDDHRVAWQLPEV